MAEIIAKPLDNRNAVLPYFRLAPYCNVLAVFGQNFANQPTAPCGRGNFSFQSNCASRALPPLNLSSHVQNTNYKKGRHLSRNDEGIWLEKETHEGLVTIARTRVLNTSLINTEFIFDDPIPHGKYFVTIRSRCGRGTEYQILRDRHEVTAL